MVVVRGDQVEFAVAVEVAGSQSGREVAAVPPPGTERAVPIAQQDESTRTGKRQIELPSPLKSAVMP